MSRRRRHRRRVAVVTGTRAEYGLLQSALAAFEAHPRLELQLIVGGMHLLKKFGHTVRTVERDGWAIDARVRMQAGDDTPEDQAAGLARGVAGVAEFLVRRKSDVVLVLGDRIEALAGALAAVTTGRLLAHIHGGDVAHGDFDDSLRHAITKLAHVHFTASRAAARRVQRMGETPGRIHCVGAIGLDRLRALIEEAPAQRSVTPTALVVYHAWGRAPRTECGVMTTILNAVRVAGLRRIVLYPNSDRGHRGVIEAIEKHAGQAKDTIVCRSLARDDYLRALLQADVLIGNSSSGIIEAPLAGTPSVNVGGRQAGRQPGGRSVIECGESRSAIMAALRKALRMRVRRGGRSVYGDGHAGERIADVLAQLPLDDDARHKLITY